MPEISVLMSVYNGELYLSKSIESILNQTFKDFEFIIINDGSKDATADIIDYYEKKDDRIKLFSQKNMGLICSLNRGIDIATCELIARQDSDDVSREDRLEKQYKFFQENLDYSVCFSWVKRIDENDDILGELNFSTNSNKIKNRLCRGSNIYTHGSVMFRKTDILRSGGYPDTKDAEDLHLWINLLKNNCKIGAIDDYLYYWRLRQDSISIKNHENQHRNVTLLLDDNNVTPKYFQYPMLHRYHTIYFRSQKRKELLDITIQLMLKKDFTTLELLKTLVSLIPFNYKFIFKYF